MWVNDGQHWLFDCCHEQWPTVWQSHGAIKIKKNVVNHAGQLDFPKEKTIEQRLQDLLTIDNWSWFKFNFFGYGSMNCKVILKNGSLMVNEMTLNVFQTFFNFPTGSKLGNFLFFTPQSYVRQKGA